MVEGGRVRILFFVELRGNKLGIINWRAPKSWRGSFSRVILEIVQLMWVKCSLGFYFTMFKSEPRKYVGRLFFLVFFSFYHSSTSYFLSSVLPKCVPKMHFLCNLLLDGLAWGPFERLLNSPTLTTGNFQFIVAFCLKV